jgi:TPP-dependent pyruvate/acetoin dehydrogenase alpha subunit
MAANSLMDRGWGKAAQLVAVDGEIRQLVEVKLSVVSAAPARNLDATCEHIALEYKNNSYDQQNKNLPVEPGDAGDAK